MLAQRVKRKPASAGLVAFAAVGIAAAGAGAAHAAETQFGVYDTQAQCDSARFWYQAYDPSGSYYCESAHQNGYWFLYKR